MSEIATREERTPQQRVIAEIRGEGFQEQIAAALPANVTIPKFVRATITALMQNADLVPANPEAQTALFQALIKCAQDGLLPDGREAALVLYSGKAQYLPMIGGLRKIAADHGWAIRTEVVYENDFFEHELGLEPRLIHRPAGLREERGQMVGAYAIGVHRDGRKIVEVFTAEDVEKVRQVSRAKDRGPWKDWTDRMWEKTVGKRLFAKLPLDKTDADRVTRILEAIDLEFKPEAATALLYGPETTPPALPAAQDPPVAPAAADDGSEPQQAEETVTDPVPVSSAPGDEPEPTLFQIPEAAIENAAATVIPKGIAAVKGKSLGEVAAAGGEEWLEWALRQADGYWSRSFRAALDLFVEHRLPDVWAAAQVGRQDVTE